MTGTVACSGEVKDAGYHKTDNILKTQVFLKQKLQNSKPHKTAVTVREQMLQAPGNKN